MLRVVVESAKGLPKNKLGRTPDPVASIIFKGKEVLLLFMSQSLYFCILIHKSDGLLY